MARKHISNLSNVSIQSDHTYSRKLSRNIPSSSSQSSHAASIHRGGVHGDGNIRTGPGHHDSSNPLTSPSNSSGPSHGDLKTLPDPSLSELIVDDVPIHGHDVENENNTESEFGDLDEDDREVCVGNNTEMNGFDMTEYFEKFRDQGLLSDDEEYVTVQRIPTQLTTLHLLKTYQEILVFKKWSNPKQPVVKNQVVVRLTKLQRQRDKVTSVLMGQ